MMEKVVIVGVGGSGREILDIFEAINMESKKWDMLGWIDDDPSKLGTEIRNHKVLGGVDWLVSNKKDVKVVISIADTKTRKRIAEKLGDAGYKFCTAIHPSVIITPHVQIGEGTIISAGSIIMSNIKIGTHVLINTDTTIAHDSIIEDYVTLSPGNHISGGTLIKTGAFVGTGAVTHQYITLGEWSVIGAGAVVLKDVRPRTVAVGVPAKEIKELQ